MPPIKYTYTVTNKAQEITTSGLTREEASKLSRISHKCICKSIKMFGKYEDLVWKITRELVK